jgi:hypothetical protein
MREWLKMRRLIVVALILSMVLPFPMMAAAAEENESGLVFDINDEVWDKMVEANKERLSNEQEGVDSRVGVILGPAAYDIDKNVFTLKAGTSGQLGCGGSNWEGAFEAAFDVEGIISGFESTAAGMVTQMPLLILCHYAPTICSYVKHFKHILNQVIKFKSSQCQAITSLVDKKLQDYHLAKQQQCINDHGNTLNAMEECKEKDLFEFLPEQDREEDGSYNITKASLKNWFLAQGETEDDAKAKAEEYGAFLPTLIIGGDGGNSDWKGQKADPKDVRKNAYALYEEHHKKSLECVQAIIDSAKSNDGMPTKDSIMACDTAYMVMTPSQLAAIYNQLGEVYFKSFMERMAQHMARQRTRNDLEKIITATYGSLSKERVESVIQQTMRSLKALEGLKNSYGASQFDLQDVAQKELAEAVKKAEDEARSKLTKGMIDFAAGGLKGRSEGGFITK